MSGKNTSTTVPQFVQGAGRDSTDLQLRSLLYLFKRTLVSRLGSFGTPKWLPAGDEDGLYRQKLDAVYNTEGFIAALGTDEYRVTVDFVKNKFRSFCFVLEHPSASFFRASSPTKTSSMGDSEFEDGFPVFRDHKDRKVRNFRFVLLPLLGVSAHSIASLLLNSDLYVEHTRVGMDRRYQLALNAVTEAIGSAGASENAPMNISEDQKALIIRNYLTTLAIEVQTARIYDEYIKQRNSPVRPPSPARIRSPSPVKSLTSTLSATTLVEATNNLSLSPPKSPERRLSPLRSSANMRLRSSSPSKLKAKPSVSKLKLEELYNPVAAPPKPELVASDSSDHEKEIDQELWAKCVLAVKDKIAREKAVLGST